MLTLAVARRLSGLLPLASSSGGRQIYARGRICPSLLVEHLTVYITTRSTKNITTALKCRTLGAKTCLISEQTDSHMLCCFAGGVSTHLSKPRQNRIDISYGNTTIYACASKAWSNNAHARYLRADQCRKCWIFAMERFQRKPHKYFDLRCPLSMHRFQDKQTLQR